MSADPNQIPQAAPYVAPVDVNAGAAPTAPAFDPAPAPAPAYAPTTTPVNSYAASADADDAALEQRFVAEGGEVVGGALIVNQKRVGEYQFGKFVPNEVGKAYAASLDAAAEAGEDAPIPGMRTSTSPEYDPTEHEPVKPEAKAAVEKVAATNAAIAEANALSDEERASQAAQDAVVAQGVKNAQAGRKKGAAPESTAQDSTGPASA